MHLSIKQTIQSAGQKTACVNQANKASGQEFYLTASFGITKQRHAIYQTAKHEGLPSNISETTHFLHLGQIIQFWIINEHA